MASPLQPSQSAHPVIEFAQASDPGRDPNKQVNEDSCGYAETRLGHLCVLCDGMGGHYGGKEASRLAITTIFEVIERAAAGAPPAATLKAAIEEAGRRVYLLGGPPDNRTRPGSTVVAMILHERGCDVAHVGDSRAYVVRASQIYPLTRDHSMVQGMIDAGMLTEAQAIGHPDANKITRALGMKPDVDVDLRPEPMELFPGDTLLLASDGLTDLALGADILACMQSALATGSLQSACDQLVQMANDRGGHDNITVQLARVAKVGPRPLMTIPQAPGHVLAGAAAPPSGSGLSAGVPAAPASNERAAVAANDPTSQRPQETLAMTEHDAPPASARHAVAPVTPAPQPAAGWAPKVTTTAMWSGSEAGGAPASKTVAQEPAAAAWAPQHYQRPPAPTPADHAAAAPLAAAAGSTRPGMTQTSSGPHAGYFGALGQPAPPPPLPTGISATDARPSNGGVVFLIIGAAAVIAVLIVLFIWAFVPQ